MRYQITINFDADRSITNAELNAVVGCCLDGIAISNCDGIGHGFMFSNVYGWGVALGKRVIAVYRNVNDNSYKVGGVDRG